MKNINIPEPCSEDWNEMTPTEKGAFCQKCALEVYDFTNKSPDEIRQVLTLNMANPVCMRIESEQLDKLNDDFSAWKIQNKQSYQRAWLFTLLVIFGMTLFSCEEDEEPVVKEYQKIGQRILNQQEGKIIEATSLNEKDAATTTDSKLNKLETCEVIDEDLLITGQAVVQDEPEKVHMLNEAHIIEDAYEMHQIHATAGVPIMTHDFNDYLVQTHSLIIPDSLDLLIKPEIKGSVYPNPASNQTTVSVNMPKSGEAQIHLFALSGQKIRTIHSGRITKGESEYSIDLFDLEMGIYLVVITSGDMKETIKFSKI